MKISTLSIPVWDQEKALQFYEGLMGFIVKHDIPLGGGNRWLTLVSPEDENGPELVLEPGPVHFEPCKVYQEALMKAGMPYTMFTVKDLQKSYEELKAKGVEFTSEPKTMEGFKFVVLNDTCGNLIQLVEQA